ncbi:MAG: lipoyl(octanoyl) transferase LipB [Ignavibacterium sp.]|nr:lipoyl(octanoyl) transferase LipB [Ignavibacterium sp.]MCX7612142.1 lipoyl(octanoyl) transferase LipB [Ignavibacterium sp.]MDW8374783.1 lipoyl(octanoyl) transferase LipB [Ignavibacteriales bacterium]
MDRKLRYFNFDIVDYKEAWDLQNQIHSLRINNQIEDTLILLEHPNTYTLGKTAHIENLIGDKNFLQKNSISVYNIDRGGDITYHGPGQLVGYPIINLSEWYQDSHKYLRALEEVLIKVCDYYGLKAERNEKYTGVWIENRKIAAIGIKISRWVTMHGFAFNVNTNLSLFNGIIPCGIPDKEVTSLQKETGKTFSITEVKEIVLNYFSEVFSYTSIINDIKLSKFELPEMKG